MRIVQASLICAAAVAFAGGCVVHEYRERPVVRETVVEGPGVQVVEYEPAPAERVYIYEPGYPPGCYYYGGYYYYGERRYERNVFITRVVNVNVHENRYVNVTENRRYGHQIEERQRTEFASTGGHHPDAHRTVSQPDRTPQHQTQRPVLVPGIQPAPPPPEHKPQPKQPHPRRPND